jgi:hypothetical protein
VSVYLGEPGLPKPHAVRLPAEALRNEWLALIGAEVDRVLDEDRQRERALAADWGRIVIVSGFADGEVFSREIPFDSGPCHTPAGPGAATTGWLWLPLLVLVLVLLLLLAGS